MLRTNAVALTAMSLMSSIDGRLSVGKCPDITYMSEFDASAYSGKWFEIVRDMTNPYTLSADCVTKEFSPMKPDGSIDLFFRGFYHPTQSYAGVNGTLYNCGEGHYDYTCEATMNGNSHRVPLRIFYTDYENIEIGYSCSETTVSGYKGKYETFALVARDPEPSVEVLEKAKRVILERIPEYDLDSSWDLHWTTQLDWCDYDWKFD